MLLAGLVMPSSTFDIELFRENLHEQLPASTTGNGVVGYSFAIHQELPGPDLVRTGAGGSARLSWDTPQSPAPGQETVDASATRDQEIASISKTITAAAILHLIQEQTTSFTEFQARLDDPVVNFLPAGWSPTAAFGTITVEELLTHTSGLIGSTNTNPGTPGGIAGGLSSNYTYAGLQQVAEQGTVFAKTPNYWTTNFAFFRVMLPYMWNEVNNAALAFNDATGILFAPQLSDDAAIRQELTDAIVSDWGLGQIIPGLDLYFVTADRVTASIYKYYVSEYVLEPAGIEDPQTRTNGSLPTLLYNSPPVVNAAGVNTGDQTLNAGSRGWNLSALDVTRFLAAIQSDEILELSTRTAMLVQELGWRPGNTTNVGNWTGDFGRYVGHDGVNFGPTIGGVPQPDPNNTIAMAFPNLVQATLLINSQIQTAPNSPILIGAAFNPGGTGTNQVVTMRNAYDNAWTELVYEGDDAGDVGSPNPDETFILRLNPADSDFLDFLHDGNLVFTRRSDTLQQLTIDGLGGRDTFLIQSLPATLELIINGGAGDDDVTVGVDAGGLADLDSLTPGTLVFHGDGGLNSLTISDTHDIDSGNIYTIRDDEVLRSGVDPLTYQFTNVANLNVNASFNADLIWLESLGAGTGLEIDADAGNDTIIVGVAHIDFVKGSVEITAGAGTDLIQFSDLFSPSPHTYDIHADHLTLDGVVSIGYDAEQLELYAGVGDDTVKVFSLGGNQSLAIAAAAGGDTIIVSPFGALSDIQGTLEVDGGTQGAGETDSLIVNDTAAAFDAVYTIENASIHRSLLGQVLSFAEIESLILNTSDWSQLIRMHGLLAGTRATIHAGAGDDHIVLGGGNAGGNLHDVIEVDAGAGDDSLTIDDRNGIAAHDFYVFHADHFVSGLIEPVIWAGIAPPETITLIANDQDSTTNIRDVLPSVQLIVHARSGDDEIRLHAAQVDSGVELNGGGGDDRILISPDDRHLDLVQATVQVAGGLGTDDLVAAYDEENAGRLGRTYEFVDNVFDVLGSLFGQLILPVVQPLDAAEVFEVHSGNLSDTFDVQSWSVPTAMHLHGNGASDELSVAAPSRTLDAIQAPLRFFADVPLLIGTPSPDDDGIVLYDQNRSGAPNYDLTTGPGVGGAVSSSGFSIEHHGVESVTVRANRAGNTFEVSGTSSFLHTTEYALHAGGGNDQFVVNTPVSATVLAYGGSGRDRLQVSGSAIDDTITIEGDRFEIAPPFLVNFPTVVTRNSIEQTSLDGADGLDLLVGDGVAGVEEEFRVVATPTPGSGSIAALPYRVVLFERLEDVAVHGNAGDGDMLRFDGTVDDDYFAIVLLAAGTATNPVVVLNSGEGDRLLRLRDYTGVGSPTIRGVAGADTFRVTISPALPGDPLRNIRLNGGSPGGGNGSDTLIVNYDDSEFDLESTSTNAHSGTLQFETPSDEEFDLLYTKFEEMLGNAF
ncbi:MAG: serine hydrolase domain-containing protein [Planctomycetaceae bacterium]